MGSRVKVGNSNYTMGGLASLSASSEAASLPVENLADPLRTFVWRSDGLAAEETVTVDLGSAQQITLIVIFNHNFTSSGTYTIQANSSDSWGSPPYEQVLEFNSRCLILVDSVAAHNLPQTYQFWRLKIEDNTNSDGYVEAGIFYIGTHFELQRDWQRDFAFQPIDPSIITRSYDRQKSVDIRTMYDVVGWTSEAISEFVEMRDLLDQVGIHEDVPLVVDSNDKTLDDGLHDLTFWGSFTAFGSVNPYKKIFDFDLAFEEAT